MNVMGFAALILLWVALAGSSPGQFVLGVMVSLASLFLSGMMRAPNPKPRPVRWLLLFVRFARELVQSNVEVALHVIRPRMRFRPGILEVPLEPMSNAQITMLANMLTLTPGTAVLDVSSDRSRLFVHVLDVRDPEQTIRHIKRGLERRVLETRP